jgi:hypothetical protein
MEIIEAAISYFDKLRTNTKTLKDYDQKELFQISCKKVKMAKFRVLGS